MMRVASEVAAKRIRLAALNAITPLVRRVQGTERLLEIRDQIRTFLEPDVEPQQPPAIVLLRSIEIRIQHDEAGDAAPAEADLEQLQRVREAGDLAGSEAFGENDRENAGRTGEVAQPILVPRAGRQGRVQHGLDRR